MPFAERPASDANAVAHAAAAAGALCERQRTTSTSVLTLALVSTVGAASIGIALQSQLDTMSVMLLGAVPLACIMAFAVVRLGYVLQGALLSVAAAATGAMVAAMTEAALVPAASVFLMLAAVLMLAAQIMPFEHAAGLTVANVVMTVAVPRFMPIAGEHAVQIPYLFVFANAVLILFAGVLRTRDASQVEAAQETAEAMTQQYERLRHATHEMQERYDRELDAASQQAHQQRNLLNAASHELRTPITPLLLQVAAFRHRYSDRLDDDQRQALSLLQRNLQRLGVLVGDLLDIARMENGHLSLKLHPCDLREVLHQARETFEHQAAEHGIDIDVDAEPLPVLADPERVSQVIYNFISNAIKFGGSGSTIRIRGDHVGDGVQIQVSDEGIGLTPEQERALFQPFSQVHDPTTGIKGTGLGLYISRGIVNQHGGQIWVRSTGPGQGTTFGFWLPEQGPSIESEQGPSTEADFQDPPVNTTWMD